MVHRTTSFLRYWLPVILWMILIFSGSTDAMSSNHTSRIIGPLLRWLKPDISEAAVGRIVLTVRKSGHLTEYAILALLFWRAWRNPARADGAWRWLEAFFAVTAAGVYAASDELHQYFVPSRGASFGDVLLDTAGAVAGVLALWAVGRWRGRW